MRLSIALTMSTLLSSSWVTRVRTWVSTDLAEPSRPSSARLSSSVMVLRWAMPPPLRIRLSAPSTSSTSGLRPVRSSGMVSPSRRVPVPAPSAGGSRLTNFSPSRLVWRIWAVALSGSFTSLRTCSVTFADEAVELDVGDLADAEVVDLHRRLRHEVEHVGELHGDGDRVVAHVGTAGQRHLVDVEVARRGGEHQGQQQAAGPPTRSHHRRSTSTRPPSVGSVSVCGPAAPPPPTQRTGAGQRRP